MIKLDFLFKRSKEEDYSEENMLVELNTNEADKVMAVGNSIENGKWFFNEDMKYSINKKVF